MNKIYKLLIVCLLLLAGGKVLKAQEIIASGYCGAEGTDGDNLAWTIDSEYTLTITGSGAMADYGLTIDMQTFVIVSTAPWSSYSLLLTSLVLETGITSIGDYAFYGCKFSGSLTIPDSVEIIGTSAFYLCGRLSGPLVIPKSVTTIENNAFGFCEGFTGDLIIPNNVTTLGSSAFTWCLGFDGILKLSDNITTIESQTFSNCVYLTGSLIIPEGITEIKSSAFNSCENLTGSLTIPDGVTSIAASAFNGCYNLSGTLTLPESLENIGANAFKGSTFFTDVYSFSETAPLLTSDVFSCPDATLHYPASATGYDENGWEYFENRVDVLGGKCGDNLYWAINNDTLRIFGTGAMYDYAIPFLPIGNIAPWYEYKDASLTLVLEDGVTYIGENSFNNSGIAGSVTLPNSVTRIGNNAFAFCALSGSFVIPSSVDSIGYAAFSQSVLITEFFIYRDNPPYVNNTIYPFYGDAKVYVPATWETYGNFSAEQLVKMPTYTSDRGWVGLPDGQVRPGEEDHVVIDAPLVLNIFPTSKVLDVKSFGNTQNGSITIEDEGQLYCESARGEVTVKKRILGYNNEEVEDEDLPNRWYTISAPFKYATSVSSLSRVNGLIPYYYYEEYDLYRYDEPTYTWQNYKINSNNNFKTLDPARGYLYASEYNTTLEFAGMMNNEDVTCNLTTEGYYFNGFHLIGNPFTHNISSAHLIATDGAELVSGYYILNDDGAWGTILGGYMDDIIKVGQGALIKTTAEGKLTISREAASPNSKRGSGNGQQFLSITVDNAKYSDRAFVVFGDGASLDKMNHENENIPMLYIPTEEGDYAIAMVEEDVNEIPVNFKTNVMGQYTISLKQENCEFKELYLLDKQTGEKVNIMENDYTFVATGDENPERFVLMKNDNSQMTTDNSRFAYVNNGDIVIYDINGNAQINIFDAMGRCVYQGESYDATNRISADIYSAGVYVIQKVDGNGVNTQKIIL